MKNHLKRTGAFLGYTLAYNITSFIFIFIYTQSHSFYGFKWLILGIAQICFTILFFNKVPLPKISNEKSFKTDLVLFFIILCAFSIIAAMYRGDWFALIFFNTYFTFPFSSSFFDSLGIYTGIYIIENAIKTYLLYTNISKKSLSKPFCIALSAIMILAYVLCLSML